MFIQAHTTGPLANCCCGCAVVLVGEEAVDNGWFEGPLRLSMSLMLLIGIGEGAAAAFDAPEDLA